MRSGPLVLALVLLLASCGDDGTSNPPPSPQCLDLAGTWEITRHCDSSLVGSSITVEQEDCAVTVVEFDFSGTVDTSGKVTTSGANPDGLVFACTGMATATTIEQSCNPECDLSLRAR